MRQKQRVKQSVKQTVVINLEKRRRQPRAKQVSKPKPLQHAPPTIQFFPMPQFSPSPNPMSMITQEQIAQKLDILRVELQKSKIPIKEKIPEKVIQKYIDEDERLKALQEQPSVSMLPFLNPSEEEITMAEILKRPPSDPIFQHPAYPSFQASFQPETQPPETQHERPNRGRPVGSVNRTKEVIEAEKRQKEEKKTLRQIQKKLH